MIADAKCLIRVEHRIAGVWVLYGSYYYCELLPPRGAAAGSLRQRQEDPVRPRMG
jgi:hypothetical protein